MQVALHPDLLSGSIRERAKTSPGPHTALLLPKASLTSTVSHPSVGIYSKHSPSPWHGHRGAVVGHASLGRGLTGAISKGKSRKEELELHRLDIRDRRASMATNSHSMPNLNPMSKAKKKSFDFGMSWISPAERRRHESRSGTKPSEGALGRANPREGAIRDIHCLGIIAEKIILAFKGRGSLKVHLQDVQSDGLKGQEIDWEQVYDKHLSFSRKYRFMEFEVPQHLPATIVVIGVSVPSCRPCTVTSESRLRARISCCGQVISSVSHMGT